MKDSENPDILDKTTEDATDYVTLQIAAAKLAATEGLSTFFGNAMRLVVFAFLCSVALMAFATAAICWLGEVIGSVPWAAVIVGGICLAAGVILFFTKKVFINPMVRMFSDMIFTPRRNRRHEHDE